MKSYEAEYLKGFAKLMMFFVIIAVLTIGIFETGENESVQKEEYQATEKHIDDTYQSSRYNTSSIK